MAKTFTAAFAQNPKTGAAVTTLAAGSIGSDSPSNTVKLVTAGSEGCIVTRLAALPRATTTASSLLVFLSKDGGDTKHLLESQQMSALTFDPTSAVPSTLFSPSEETPWRLEAGDELYVASAVELADGVVFVAEYTDF